MAVYAIGDVQGCLEELHALLAQVAFDPQRDRLWFVGDLVNRGPDSLAVLRLVKALGERAVVVLGNHDLHLLATAAGARDKSSDTLREVLNAPDCAALLAWLRECPLLHHDAALGYTLVHAGVPPQWDVEEAAGHARELEAVLRSGECEAFLRAMYGDEPDRWSPGLTGWERLRYITNAFTRMRYCGRDGRLALEEEGPPGREPPGVTPWFAVPGRRTANARIIFGHWATLQLERPLDPIYGVFHVDTGCVWGGRLTALRLEDQRYFSVPSRQRRRRA